MYFLVKKENVFDKYNGIWEKVSNIIQCFYAPVILIDSIYRKDKNYYPQAFLELVVIEEKT